MLDTYTRAAHHRVSALLEVPGTRPALLHFRHPDGELALPLLLRPLPDRTGWDATTPYGYGGPLGSGEGAVTDFGPALDAWAQKNRVVTTFLRLHPVLANAQLVPASAELLTVGATVGWDTSTGRDLVHHLHPHHRRAARRADRAGLKVTVVQRPPSLDRFRNLYFSTMRRHAADPYFYFPPAYWEALLTNAEELQPVLIEGWLGDRFVAGLLCFMHAPWLHYHLGGFDETARSIGASHRCFLAAAEWAQSRGMTGFHIGGGLGGRSTSSLFMFKRRFDPGNATLDFHIAKLVHDRATYVELAGTDSTAGFFPPWRRGRP
jgi:hypothetical protein